MIEDIRNVEIPKTLSSRLLAKDTVVGLRASPEKIELANLEQERLKRVFDVLTHPGLELLIDQGKVTFGMVKPRAFESKGLTEGTDAASDDIAAQRIIKKIGDEHVIFQLPFILTREDAEAFYAPQKDQYSNHELPSGKTAWDTIMELMLSGPATTILIYREEGDAVSWWRNRMGETNPIDADPNSIRGKYALPGNLPNNLVHGSDKPEEVKREIGVISKVVEELVKKASLESRNLPQEDTLREVGFLKDDETLLSVEQIFEGKGAESYMYGYRVYIVDQNGVIVPKFLKEKYIVSMACNLEIKAKNQEEKIHLFEQHGIPIQELYGRKGATLYSKFIPHDGRERMTRQIQQVDSFKDNRYQEEQQALDQLIDIAFRLDNAGFHPLNFIRDLLYDDDKKRFVYMDFGFDLGYIADNGKSNLALKTLKSIFNNHQVYIEHKYNQVKNPV